MKNVFLIGTEHQLFQVDYVIKHFNLASEQILLIIEDLNDNPSFIERSKDKYGAKNVVVFRNWTFRDIFLNKERHKTYISFCKKIKENYGNQIVFFASHYNSDNTMLFVAIVKPESFFIMDEGTASFQVSLLRNKKNQFHINHFIKSLLYGLRIAFPKKLTYFTQFNLNINPRDSIEKYEIEKGANVLVQLDPDVSIFLGSSVVEANLMEEEIYLKLLAQVYQQKQTKDYHYYPHRKENPSKLIRITEIGFIIKRNEVPFETYFKENTTSATILSSFFTTSVLDNIAQSNLHIPKLIIFTFGINYLLDERDIYAQILSDMSERIEFIEIDINTIRK